MSVVDTLVEVRLGEEDARPEYSSTEMKPQMNDDELIAMFSKDTTKTKKDATNKEQTNTDTTNKKKSKDKKKSNKK